MCVTLDSLGNVLTFDPRSRAESTSITIDTHAKNGMGPITCPTTRFCVAVDPIGGYLVQGDPVLGGGWTLIPVPGHWPNDVACASRSECVAVDSFGYALLGPASVTTGSGARATGFGAGNAALSFTLTAAAGAPAIRSIELPSVRGGIQFASSTAAARRRLGTLRRSRAAPHRRRQQGCPDRLARRPRRPASGSRSRDPRSLRARRSPTRVKTRRQTAFGVAVVAVNAHHAATDLTLDAPAS